MDNNSRYNNILSILKSLNYSDLIILKSYLSSFYEKYSNSESVYLDYVNHMIDNHYPDYSSFRSKLNVSEDALRKNLERLRDKIWESQTLDISLDKRKKYAKPQRVRLRIKKDILKAHLAYIANNQGDTLYYNRRALKNSVKFEYFDEGIEACRFLKEVISARSIKFDFKRLLETENSLLEKRTLFESAKSLKKDVLAEGMKSYHQEEVMSELERRIELLKESENGLSSRAYREIFYAEQEVHGFRRDWDEAFKACLQIKDLIESTELLRNSSELGVVNVNLGIYKLLSHQFQIAQENLKEAIEHFEENSVYSAMSKEHLFIGYFHNNQLEEAMEIFEELEKSPLALSDLHKSKWSYWKSTVQFKQGNFKASINLLDGLKEIEKDKEGWNIFIRILRILCYVELQNFEVAEQEIENLRRYLQGKIYSSRIKLFYKLLLKAMRKGFDFSSLGMELFENINAENRDLNWEVLSPEMINLFDWLKEKRNQDT